MSALLSILPQPGKQLFFAGPGQSHKFEVRVTEPEGTANMYINLYICFYAGANPVLRSYPAIDNSSYYSAEFDVNEIFSGVWKDIITRTEIDSGHFQFPGDPDYPLMDKANWLLMHGYFNFSYSYSFNGEMVEDGLTSNENVQDYEFLVINGGVSKIMQAWLFSENNNITSWLTTGRRFLTWMPPVLRVHPRQPVRLYYYNPESVSIRINVNVYYTDGTMHSDTIGGYNPGVLLEVLAGMAELRLKNFDISKTIQKYELWLQDSEGSHITEKRTFIPDYSFYERNDIFIYRNSLGVHEVFWSHGDRSEKIKIEKSQTLLPLLSPSTRYGSLESTRGMFFYKFQSNTGYFPKADRAWVNEFLNCGEACFPSGFVIHPVLIEPGEFSLAEDRDDLFSVDFNWRVAHNEHFYSANPPVTSPFGDFNDDFNLDFFIS